MPGSGMPIDEIKRRTEIANSIARKDSNVTVLEVGEGPLSIESSIEEHISVGPMLVKLRSIRDEGPYDAIIIGCAGDPGLSAARELMEIPVIGPAESSYHFACMVSDRFSVLLTPQAGVESGDSIRRYIRTLGLENRLTSIEFLKSSVVDMWRSDDDALVKQASGAIENAAENGAGCVVFGCMSMGFQLIDEQVRDSIIPIINPLKTAIKTAELFTEMGMKHSRITYPAADLEKLDQTVFKSDKER